MNYTLVLAPDLPLDAGAFVAAWNADPHAQALASATLARGQSQQFSADYVQIALTIVEGLDQLPVLGKRALWQGAQDVLIESLS